MINTHIVVKSMVAPLLEEGAELASTHEAVLVLSAEDGSCLRVQQNIPEAGVVNTTYGIKPSGLAVQLSNGTQLGYENNLVSGPSFSFNHKTTVTGCVEIPGNRIATCSNFDTKIHVWDCTRNCKIHEINCPSRVVSMISLQDRGHMIVAGLGEGQILLFNVDNGELVHQLQHPEKSTVRDLVQVSPCLVASRTVDELTVIRVWDIGAGQLAHTVNGVIFDWKNLTALCRGELYSIATSQLITKFPEVNVSLLAHPNRAVAYSDSRVHLCELPTGRTIIAICGQYLHELIMMDKSKTPRPPFVTVGKVQHQLKQPNPLYQMLQIHNFDSTSLKSQLETTYEQVKFFETTERECKVKTLIMWIFLSVLVLPFIWLLKLLIWDFGIYLIWRAIITHKAKNMVDSQNGALKRYGVYLTLLQTPVLRGTKQISNYQLATLFSSSSPL
jgi:hypothetical protein